MAVPIHEAWSPWWGGIEQGRLEAEDAEDVARHQARLAAINDRLPSCGPTCRPAWTYSPSERRPWAWVTQHDAGAHEQAVVAQHPAQDSRVALGPLLVDLGACLVWVDGVAVDLTPTEWRFLACLARRVGQVVTHAELLDEVWGWAVGASERHIVRVCLARLRARLGVAGPLVVTRVGVGYGLGIETPNAISGSPRDVTCKRGHRWVPETTGRDVLGQRVCLVCPPGRPGGRQVVRMEGADVD